VVVTKPTLSFKHIFYVKNSIYSINTIWNQKTLEVVEDFITKFVGNAKFYHCRSKAAIDFIRRRPFKVY
jgi:hypothetical protein